MPDRDAELYSSPLTIAWSEANSEPANPWSNCECAPLSPVCEVQVSALWAMVGRLRVDPAILSHLSSSLHSLFLVVHSSLAFDSAFGRCFFHLLHVLWWFTYTLSCVKLRPQVHWQIVEYPVKFMEGNSEAGNNPSVLGWVGVSYEYAILTGQSHPLQLPIAMVTVVVSLEPKSLN